MSVPFETSTPKEMIAPAEIDHFHDISEICSPKSEKKPIHMFDTPVFVFTKESEMWHRMCLFSNNTQDVLYSNIRKLLLEDSFNEEQDVGVFLFHLQDVNGDLDLMQDKEEKFQLRLNNGLAVSDYVGWLTKEFKNDWGSKYDDDVPNEPFNLSDSECNEKKTYPSRILKIALTFKITPVSKRSPSVFLSCFYCCTSPWG